MRAGQPIRRSSVHSFRCNFPGLPRLRWIPTSPLPDHAMSIMSDRWISRMALEHNMIDPYEGRQVRKGVISYGVSSYGYDMRVAHEFRIFTNVLNSIVDPKNFDPKSFVEWEGEVCIVPPNSFATARHQARHPRHCRKRHRSHWGKVPKVGRRCLRFCSRSRRRNAPPSRANRIFPCRRPCR